MDAIETYFGELQEILAEVRATQSAALHEGAKMLAEATLAGHNLYAFGCGHAGLVTLELYYRTGGMATINPVRMPGLHLDVDPATLTSQMERLEGYGRAIVEAIDLRAGDVIVIHSVSGRNPVPVEVALCARERGARVIALTNLRYSRAVSPRSASGKKLYEAADLLLDNCGCEGDAMLTLAGLPAKVAPSSTSVGAAMLNAMVAQAVHLILAAGATPPVFVSANLDGGDEHNRRVLAAYRDHIFYMK